MPDTSSVSNLGIKRGRLDVPSCGRLNVPSFSMVPLEVIEDPGLKHADKCVYMAMAHMRCGSIVKAGERLVARRACMDRRTFKRCIARLIERRHVEYASKEKRERASYRLTSALFAKRETLSENRQVPVGKKTGRARAENSDWPMCPECRKKRQDGAKMRRKLGGLDTGC
jgi:hypothetical protein